MKASIYISSETIKVISYTKIGHSIAIKDYFTYPLPEECVINGVIIESAPVIDGLRKLKTSHPQVFMDVSLVIDGSFVYTKKITVPGKLGKLQCDDVIRDEFADISTDSENLICDYFLLSENEEGSKDVLACAVENMHAQAYLDIFNTAEVKITTVHLGILTVLHFIKSKPELRDIPFVLNIVDDEVLLSMIFQTGINVFQSRTRLYGENREMLVNNTLDGLSGIIQFNKSQNFDDLTSCYYLGLSDEDIAMIRLNNAHPDIKYSLLPIFNEIKGAELLQPGAHFAYLNTLMPKTQADLFSNIKVLEKSKKQKRPTKIWIPILAGTVFLLLATIITLSIMVFNIGRDIRELNVYMSNPAIVDQKAQIDALTSDTAHINNLYDAVAGQREQTAEKAQVSRQLLESIIRIGGDTITITGINFSSDNKTISISCSSPTEFDASAFVEALNNNDSIDSAYYIGYTTGASGEFVFTIDVIAAEWREEVSP